MLLVYKYQPLITKWVFLGFLISSNSVEANPSKVAAIRERDKPLITIEIQAFINAIGYF